MPHWFGVSMETGRTQGREGQKEASWPKILLKKKCISIPFLWALAASFPSCSSVRASWYLICNKPTRLCTRNIRGGMEKKSAAKGVGPGGLQRGPEKHGIWNQKKEPLILTLLQTRSVTLSALTGCMITNQHNQELWISISSSVKHKLTHLPYFSRWL